MVYVIGFTTLGYQPTWPANRSTCTDWNHASAFEVFVNRDIGKATAGCFWIKELESPMAWKIISCQWNSTPWAISYYIYILELYKYVYRAYIYIQSQTCSSAVPVLWKVWNFALAPVPLRSVDVFLLRSYSEEVRRWILWDPCGDPRSVPWLATSHTLVSHDIRYYINDIRYYILYFIPYMISSFISHSYTPFSVSRQENDCQMNRWRTCWPRWPGFQGAARWILWFMINRSNLFMGFSNLQLEHHLAWDNHTFPMRTTHVIGVFLKSYTLWQTNIAIENGHL